MNSWVVEEKSIHSCTQEQQARKYRYVHPMRPIAPIDEGN